MTDRIEQIGVALDNSAAADAALNWACDRAETRQAHLHVVSVDMPTAGPRPVGSLDDSTPQEHREFLVERILARCRSANYSLQVLDVSGHNLARTLGAALAGSDAIAIGAPDSGDNVGLALELGLLCGCPVVQIGADGDPLTNVPNGKLVESWAPSA
jgi:nucleotide-binding universal stress UspA family protein